MASLAEVDELSAILGEEADGAIICPPRVITGVPRWFLDHESDHGGPLVLDSFTVVIGNEHLGF